MSQSLKTAWIGPLAEPYLRGFVPVPTDGGSLRGYWFWHPEFLVLGPSGRRARRTAAASKANSPRQGFFFGYLVSAKGFEFLKPQIPECLGFVTVQPLGSRAHRRLVAAPDTLVRRTFEYIRWLTHRPPRFAFYEHEITAMVRHCSMADWPAAKYEHFSRNFYIETLAWLVRSAIVRKLLEAGPPPKARTRRL